MNRSIVLCFLTVVLLSIPCLVFAIEVEDIGIGRSVEDRALLDSGTEFSISDGTLYCFTRILNGSGTTIRHIWHRDDEVISEVSLTVGSDNWRTWSSKLLAPGMEGDWNVKVVDSEGDVMESVKFTLNP